MSEPPIIVKSQPAPIMAKPVVTNPQQSQDMMLGDVCSMLAVAFMAASILGPRLFMVHSVLIAMGLLLGCSTIVKRGYHYFVCWVILFGGCLLLGFWCVSIQLQSQLN